MKPISVENMARSLESVDSLLSGPAGEERTFFLAQEDWLSNMSELTLLSKALTISKADRMYNFYICRGLIFDLLENVPPQADVEVSLVGKLSDPSDWGK